jgi:glucose/mannose-6-phosphate isomerase
MLDDLRELKQRDHHATGEALSAFPAQCREAVRLRATPAPADRRPSLVVVAGMGGSAAGGDLLAAVASDQIDVPILVHRGYGLPALASERALVIASSYSGDTAEVLSAAEVAVARRVPLVAITTGGRLAKFAAEHGVPRVSLPSGLQPRMALGYLFFPALGLLRQLGLEVATDAEIAEALEVVGALAVECSPGRPSVDNEAKRLATAIGSRMPAIYGGPETAAIAYRFKTDVEENAKTFAVAGALPEMNHNEIEAWRGPTAAALHLVLLRDRAEGPEIARRFAVLRQLIDPAAGGISEVWARGETRLARLLSLLYVGQWTSYYLALLRGVDPWSVPLLDELKRRMSSGAP